MVKKSIGRPKKSYKHISPLTDEQVTAEKYYKDCRKVRLLNKQMQEKQDLSINKVQIWTLISEKDRRVMNLWCERRGFTQTDFIRMGIRDLASKLLSEELQYKKLFQIKPNSSPTKPKITKNS